MGCMCQSKSFSLLPPRSFMCQSKSFSLVLPRSVTSLQSVSPFQVRGDRGALAPTLPRSTLVTFAQKTSSWISSPPPPFPLFFFFGIRRGDLNSTVRSIRGENKNLNDRVWKIEVWTQEQVLRVFGHKNKFSESGYC